MGDVYSRYNAYMYLTMQLLLGMFYMYGMAGAERNFQVSSYTGAMCIILPWSTVCCVNKTMHIITYMETLHTCTLADSY